MTPPWLEALRHVAASAGAADLAPSGAPSGAPLAAPSPASAGTRRRSAVLMLFGGPDGGGPDGGGRGALPDVLLTLRSATMRTHPGQVSFPGGAVDPSDAGPAACALREANEETGVDPDAVEVLGLLPEVHLPVGDAAVTPVLGWWRAPGPVRAVDAAEVAEVARVPVAALVDPANRFRVRHPSGYVGPGFEAGGLFVWGFTAALLDGLLHLAGWERPWDRARVEPLPPALLHDRRPGGAA